MAYELDEKDARSMESEFKRKRVLGVPCPVRNNTGEECNECKRVRALFRHKTAESEAEGKARTAKPTYFLNAMLRKDNKVTVLKLGREVANDLYEKCNDVKERYGRALGLADPNKARWLSIKKTGAHPNFKYKFEVLDDEAPSVTKELVDTLDNHKDITQRFNDGELEIFNVSDLTTESSVEFRMLPIPVGTNKARLMSWVYYHWRCRETDILGGDSADEVVSTQSVPKEFAEYMKPTEVKVDVQKVSSVKKEYSVENPPPCYGYYDGLDECRQKDCDNVRETCATKAGYLKQEDGSFVKAKPKK